ncbi:DegQ family serine endoprotease [Zavarzinia sp. CC-PAN008]|uniref:DegQ family serine endoprotease n=1 Tax=Zavarzinia sp. CC-PAN008 TaxID=3243332 RepID=UPI003F747930
MTSPRFLRLRSSTSLRALAFGLALAIPGTYVLAASDQAPAVNAGPVTAGATALVTLPSFSDLAKRVTPAVVNITAQVTQEADGPQAMPFGDPDMQEFMRRFGLPVPPQQQPRERRGMAAGSGFVIDPAGYIVTNNHVVDHGSDITVTLQDGRQFKATVVGTDGKTDVALLKIDTGAALPYLQFGDSGRVSVGDWVLAVGNPFGLGGTVTAGIVSALGRDIHSGPYDDYMQIDASINSGNSGGPTFNTNGEVIGINTAIFSPNGGSVGIGFAIPSNLVKSIVAQLRESGTVARGWLGVQIQPVTEDLAGALGLEKGATGESTGALVAEVLPNSPAHKAGFRTGDVITKFDQTTIGDVRDLTRTVAQAKPDQSYRVAIIRDGQPRTIDVRIEALKDQDRMASRGDGSGAEQQQEAATVADVRVEPLTNNLRRRMGLPRDVSGVVVTDVDGRAAEVLQPGDIIEKVGSSAVTTPQEFNSAVTQAKSEGRNAALLLVTGRDGASRFVALPFAKA